MEVWLVTVTYDHQPTISPEGYLPIRSVQPIRQLHQEEGEWVVPLHARATNGKMAQVAFRFSEAVQRVSYERAVELFYDDATQLWIQRQRFINRRRGPYYLFNEKHPIEGMTNAGSLSIVYEAEATYRETIRFESNVLTTYYERLVQDLYYIHEQLVTSERHLSTTAVHEKKETYERQLAELERLIQQLMATPHVGLHIQKKRAPYDATKKFDIQAEIERQIVPGLPNYTQRVVTETVHTRENEMMKQALVNLKEYARRQQLYFALQEENEQMNVAFTQSQIEKFQEEAQLLQTLDEVYEEAKRKSERCQRAVVQKAKERFACHDVNTEEVEWEFLIRSGASVPLKLDEYNGALWTVNHYDERESHFEHLSYRWRNSTYRGYSHFTKVSFHSKDVLSRWYLYQCFTNERYTDCRIRVTGKVVARGNDNPVDEGYGNEYEERHFRFITIDRVEVEGMRIEPPTEEEMERFAKQICQEQETEQLHRLKQSVKLAERTEKAYDRVQDDRLDFTALEERIDRLLNEPFFQSIHLTSYVPLEPTTKFLQHPSYYRAWTIIQEWQRPLPLERSLETIHVTSEKVEQLYETWVLYQTIHLLTEEMGWTLKNGERAESVLRNYLIRQSEPFPMELFKRFEVELYVHEYTLVLSYEPVKKAATGASYRPDYYFTWKRGNITLGTAILDAKYRDYDEQGEATYIDDLESVAIGKYDQLVDTFSGIVHSAPLDQVESTWCDYDYGHHNHRFGSFPLHPNNKQYMKTWLKLMMEYHFQDYDTCWSCGEREHVKKEQLLTKSGYNKYHYTCSTCDEFWVRNHCSEGKGEHLLVKHFINYHEERTQSWYVNCPKCEQQKNESFS